MKLTLQTKLQQILAPQLIQSLQLLQVPVLELEQILKHELQVNPLLEELEELEEEEEKEEEEEEEEKEEEEEEEETMEDSESIEDKIDWDDYLQDGYEGGYNVKAEPENEDLPERVPVSRMTFAEHLLSQLRLNNLTDEEYHIGEFIIGNINDRGYLTLPLEEIARILDQPIEKCQAVLDIIQTFEPVGVGARDLRESLLIQLREWNIDDPVAKAIIENHLDEVDKKSIAQLAKALKVIPAQVQEALERISSLSPNPGFGYVTSDPEVVVPDLLVEKVDDRYVAVLNDRNIPRLRVSPLYRSLLTRSDHTNDETKNYIKEKLNAARWLIKSIDQRRSTMLKVMNYLIYAQRQFFDKGISEMKPMTLQEVAEATELHISTISRVVNNKYVQTPRGIFELKYFFGSKVESDNGEEVSSKSVKDKISNLIAKEDPRKPLSDQKITNLLKAQGLQVARRTVAKYREQLKIMPARFRKRV
jgi:RNA polymerase sigma-54 factor